MSGTKRKIPNTPPTGEEIPADNPVDVYYSGEHLDEIVEEYPGEAEVKDLVDDQE